MDSHRCLSDEEEDYRRRLRHASVHHDRPSSSKSKYRSCNSPDRRYRDRTRSYSPYSTSHSRERSRSSHYHYEENRKYCKYDTISKEKDHSKLPERYSSSFPKNCESRDRIEGKAREKLTVLSKLGIELKLPEQDKKNKLWKGSKEGCSSSVWNSAHFSDSKATAKFKRLMGIKCNADGKAESSSSSISQEQATLFKKMEEEYEVARQTTHTMRGVGLGFPK